MITRASLHQQRYNQFVSTSSSITNCALSLSGIYTIVLTLTSLKKEMKWPILNWLVSTHLFTYNMFFMVMLTNIVLGFFFLMGINLYYQLKYRAINQCEAYLLTFTYISFIFLFSILLTIIYILFVSGTIYQFLFRLIH